MARDSTITLFLCLLYTHCSDILGRRRRNFQELKSRTKQSLRKGFSRPAKPPEDVVCPRCTSFGSNLVQLLNSDPLSALFGSNQRGQLISVPKSHISTCPVCRFFQRLGYASHKDPYFPSQDSSSGDTYDFQIYLVPLTSPSTLYLIQEGERYLIAARESGPSEVRHLALGVGDNVSGATALQFATRILERGLICPATTARLGSRTPPEHGIPFLQAAKVDHASVDYQACRGWLARCQSKHSGSCQPVMRRASGLPIKCIDCGSLTLSVVVIHDSDEYVALSYVWGNPALPKMSKKGIQVPKVVEDAMTVTRNLGKRYLWVDQYCVEQKNHDIKALEIAAMDKIYAGAVVTIVACAGSDSSVGLPGVSTRMRIKQPYVQVSDEISLVSTFPPLHMAVKDTTWMERGWTYQEAALSKRTLFFTDLQVYYTCSGMTASESLPVPEESRTHGREQSKPSVSDLGMSNLLLPSADFIYRKPGQKPQANISSLDILKDHIVRYMSRKLSYPEDILNALCGILTRSPFLSFWGIPIAIRNEPDDFDITNERDLELGFLGNLFWFNEREKEGYENDMLVPRDGFPSWSWAGWRAGRIQYHYRMMRTYGEYRHTVRDEPATPLVLNLGKCRDIKVELESQRGERQTFTELLQQRANGQMILPELTPYIHLETIVMRVRFNGTFSTFRPWFLCGCHPTSVHPPVSKFETMTIWPSPIFHNRRKYPDCIATREWDCMLLFVADNPDWEEGLIWVFLIIEWDPETDTAYRIGSLVVPDRPDHRTHPQYPQNREFRRERQFLEQFPGFDVQRDLLDKVPCTRRSVRLG